ncbi:MAG TPA: anti-sigma factor [Chloroflexota bacterium]|jgi:anti-sigma-K factor RskA
MAATPVDDHTQEFEELAGLSALDVLEGDERVRFALHYARCERCQLMVRHDREALHSLPLTAPEMDPSPDFKARLMQRGAAELAAQHAAEQSSSMPTSAPPTPVSTPESGPQPRATGDRQPPGLTAAQQSPGPVTDRPPAPDHFASAPMPPPPADAPIPRRPTTDVPPTIQFPPRAGDARTRSTAAAGPARVIPLWRRQPILRTLAAVFVLGLVTVGAYSYENQPVATVELHGDAPGTARVIIRRNGAAELEMRDVPDPGPGFVYEAWIIPQGQQPIAAGVAATGNARVPLEGDPRGKTVAITREPGRVNAPTSNPLMAGAVQS